ncbi:hypothetical protein ACMD2_01380 [Ananas comosus]|uniref:Uncharacterized protein n=1 Tax=Ananas comosus TaxID=4615 RepID=A0A199VF80_ANACO|nr:hypothetical protein ACMD2_01380 [Ananas comosus]
MDPTHLRTLSSFFPLTNSSSHVVSIYNSVWFSGGCGFPVPALSTTSFTISSNSLILGRDFGARTRHLFATLASLTADFKEYRLSSLESIIIGNFFASELLLAFWAVSVYRPTASDELVEDDPVAPNIALGGEAARFHKEIRLRSGSQRKLTCSPLRFNCLTAISILSCDSSDPLIEPLYTHPNPPSPTISERLKFFVALFNSENVKALRLLGL